MSSPVKEEIRSRVRMLRDDMERSGIDLLLISSTDPHASEYVPDHYKVTEFFSGCTSDNATLIVEKESARLWTDGRYFISAAEELRETGIGLMKMGQPSVPDVKTYLSEHLEKGMTLGFDGRCIRASSSLVYRQVAEQCGAAVDSTYAPADTLWIGRPALPGSPIWILPEKRCGVSAGEKLRHIRAAMTRKKASYYILSKLDDIMWLLNIRGGDIACSPVALSYLLLGQETGDLFVQKGAVTPELEALARELHIKLHSYEDLFSYLGNYHFDGPVLVDSSESSDAVMNLLSENAVVTDCPNLTGRRKAVKNEVEIRQLRQTYLEDSVAVCRFLFRMKKRAGEGALTEYTAAQEMDGLRRENPEFLDLSFPTISAWGANAAMAHYILREETAAQIPEEGFLLVDSGGQYLGGTTDVTRTIAMGSLTEEMKRDFTLVAASHLRLMNARFPEGTTGGQLDILARERLYQFGLDYNHGTGHGIGFVLNVHEAPPSISKATTGSALLPVKPGMIVSDEPGLYREGRYGIRTESILLCVRDEETEFGQFLRFSPLTFAPIDLDAIDPAYLEKSDRERLNRYHSQVWEAISPHLEGEELVWLRQATRALS